MAPVWMFMYFLMFLKVQAHTLSFSFLLKHGNVVYDMMLSDQVDTITS